MIVEDEVLISMLLEDMLQDMGYEVAAKASRIDEALEVARSIDVDGAILDVNVSGKEIFPVAEILAARGIPFIFATGYGARSLAPPFEGRPTLQKPFQQEELEGLLLALFGTVAG